MKNYISVREASYKWGVSERRVNQFCTQGRIPCLTRFGRSWYIPADAVKPTDPLKTNPAKEAPNMQTDNTETAAIGTSTLLSRILKASNLRSFLDQNAASMATPTFVIYLDKLCKERNMVREHVILRAGIDRGFGHQLFRGSRKPSRDNVLRLAFGFGLDVEETQELLRAARRTLLYPRYKRDAAILYGLAHHNTIMEIQSSLSDMGMTLLGGERHEHTER